MYTYGDRRTALDAASTDAVVVVTTVRPSARRTFLWLLFMHHKLKWLGPRSLPGLIGVSYIVFWREGVVLNVSLWRKTSDILNLGEMSAHINAVRALSRARGETHTECGVFVFNNGWRQVIMGTEGTAANPLSMLLAK